MRERLEANDWESEKEKDEVTHHFLSECDWTQHYYGVNGSAVKMARTLAKQHFFERVEKIKELKAGKPFFGRSDSTDSVGSSTTNDLPPKGGTPPKSGSPKSGSPDPRGGKGKEKDVPPPSTKGSKATSKSETTNRREEFDDGEDEEDRVSAEESVAPRKSHQKGKSPDLLSLMQSISGPETQSKRSGSPKPKTVSAVVTGAKKRPAAVKSGESLADGEGGGATKKPRR